jgi:hypothetical protein
MLEAYLGTAQHHEHLTIFPILVEEDRSLPHVLLQEALKAGDLSIKEKGSGTVPLLKAKNKSPHPILILDGEQLIGAKQNRITSRSIVLPSKSTTEIPVSCMEQGRWKFNSRDFSPAAHHAPSKVRRHARHVEASSPQASYRDLASAQGAVWEEIRSFGSKLGGRSPTEALDAVFDHHQDDLEQWIEAFPALDLQVGILAFSGTEPLGLDALGAPALYASVHRRLLTGYVLDALESRGGAGPRPPQEAGLTFVNRVQDARRVPAEPLGSGEYRVLKETVLGGELVEGDALLHLSAFPLDVQTGRNGNGGDGSPVYPMSRPSLRRRSF